MGRSKIVFGDDVLIDLTADTVVKEKLLKGVTAHDASGEVITGICEYDANTQDATANASEILSGSTAYNKGVKITGEMPNNGEQSGVISTVDGSISIKQGYHDGSGKIAIDPVEQAKIIASNIREGIEVLGVIGTMSGSEDSKPQIKTVTPKTTSQVIIPDEGYNCLSQVTVNAIPYVETNNSAGGITVTIG